MAAYDFNYELPEVGTLADTTYKVIDSFAAAGIIQIGSPVKRETTNDPDSSCLAWADSINVPFLGIALRGRGVENNLYTGQIQYKQYDMVKVLTEGRTWIFAKDADDVVAGEKAYLEVTTGLYTNIGTNNLLIGKFLTTAGIDNKVIIEIGKL